VSPLEPETPPVGEEIHLPPPTVVPALTAIGVTLLLVGFTTYIALSVVAGLLTLGCALSCIRTARAETDELPLE
jgi:hypothetical protein